MKQRIGESASEQLLDAAARLAAYGYRPDVRLADGDELFGFIKPLGNDMQTIVQFQRRGVEWTINLLRLKSGELGPHDYGGYSGALGARLSHVLWFVAAVRKGDNPDRWWTLDTLDAALDLLIDYGLPWLEDPHASKPWEMPANRWSEFAAAVLDIAGPELSAQGYRAATLSLAGRFPYPYFVKALPDGEFALIEFQSTYSLDPTQFSFDVRLQRKASANPLDFGGAYGAWRTASLGQLVWRARATAGMFSIEDVKSLLWHYADRAELADRLREVLGHVSQIAYAWFEGDRAADTIESARIEED
jgi:hypothetical protein